MINVIIITHGEFGRELLASAQNILGFQEKVSAISQSANDDLFSLKKKIEARFSQFAEAKGFLVLVDLIGGTPMNAVAGLLKHPNLEIVSGVNLPMLLEVLLNRERLSEAKELVQIACESGKKGIVNVRELIKN